MNLSFVKLHPDGAALARWAAAAGVAAFRDDLGYAAHAASKAVFGDLAPKPFALRTMAGRLEMVGYTEACASESRACRPCRRTTTPQRGPSASTPWW